MAYRVELSSAAQRDIKGLPPQDQQRLAGPVLGLGENPRPHGALKLRGGGGLWRIRMGPYRVIYEIHDRVRLVSILKVDRRSETTYAMREGDPDQ